MILDEMKAREGLTVQEKVVLDYIVKHPRDILGMNIKELARESFSSAATIVRLCKKTGLKGYSDFKYRFASEFPSIIGLSDDLNVQSIDANVQVGDVFKRVELVHKRAIEYTSGLLNKEKVLNIVGLIEKAPRIEIYGEGLNYELARSFCLEFEEVGCESNAYNSVNPMHTEMGKDKRHPILAFILTHTGNNEHMYDIADKLKNKNYRTVVICDNAQRPICQICDESVVIMTTEGTLDLSNIVYISSLQYLFDVFVSLKLKSNYHMVRRVSNKVDSEKDGK